MAEKTPGTSRKRTSSKKSSTKEPKTVTPIDQVDGPGAAQETVTVTQPYPGIEEEIRLRAYELYEARGRQEGFDLEDWKRAEEEVLSRYQREKSA